MTGDRAAIPIPATPPCQTSASKSVATRPRSRARTSITPLWTGAARLAMVAYSLVGVSRSISLVMSFLRASTLCLRGEGAHGWGLPQRLWLLGRRRWMGGWVDCLEDMVHIDETHLLVMIGTAAGSHARARSRFRGLGLGIGMGTVCYSVFLPRNFDCAVGGMVTNSPCI